MAAPSTAAPSDAFYCRYYVGHRGKFGHEFLEFEFRPDGKVRRHGSALPTTQHAASGVCCAPAACLSHLLTPRAGAVATLAAAVCEQQ